MDETHDSVVLFLQDGGSTIEFSVSRDVVSKSSSYLRDVIREFWGNQGIKLQFKNLSQVLGGRGWESNKKQAEKERESFRSVRRTPRCAESTTSFIRNFRKLPITFD